MLWGLPFVNGFGNFGYTRPCALLDTIKYFVFFLHTQGLTSKMARNPAPWAIVGLNWMHNNGSCMHKSGICPCRLDTQLFTDLDSFCVLENQGCSILSRLCCCLYNIRWLPGKHFERVNNEWWYQFLARLKLKTLGIYYVNFRLCWFWKSCVVT